MRFEMMKTLKGRQDRFIYYILGLNVASIGFTISKTYEMAPNRIYDVFLALALLGWFVSTIASIRWIYIQFRTMQTNLDIVDLLDGFYDKTKYDEAQAEELLKESKSSLLTDASKCEKAIKVTLFFFIGGMVFFLFWRIFDAFQISL